MIDTTDRTYTALAELRDRLPRLREGLHPGTPRRWNQSEISNEQLARMDEMVKAEKLERDANAVRGIKVLGESKAPLNIHVLDVEVQIHAGIALLERSICDWFGLTPLVGVSPAEVVTRIVGLLRRVELEVELAEHVRTEAVRLAARSARVLGESEPVHQLDARCPVCDARSLRALPERGMVACVNRSCRCTDEGCTCQAGRRHFWPFESWPELAEFLAAVA